MEIREQIVGISYFHLGLWIELKLAILGASNFTLWAISLAHTKGFL